jgi:MFS family permease
VDHSKNRARYTLFILFAINLLNFYDRYIPGALAEPIRKEWGLSDSQLGWLTFAFTLLYAVVGLPLGRWSDRGKRPQILTLGVAAWSILTAASGIAWNYGSMFAVRLGVGVGEAVCAPASNSLIGDLYPAAQRARAIAFFMLGLPLGGFLGTYVSGHVAAAYGWRMAFYVGCIPGLLLTIPTMRLLDPPRAAAESLPLAGRPSEPLSFWASCWAVLKIPSIRWIAITGALYNANMYTIAAFLPAYLHRYHALDQKQSTTIAAILYGVSGVLGILLGGWAADRVATVRANGRLLVCAASAILMAFWTYLALNHGPGQTALFLVLMTAGCTVGYVYYAAVYATIQDLVPPSLRGTAMALYFLAMYALGGSYGPVLAGKLSDHFAKQAMAAAGANALNEHFRAVGLHSAMYMIPVCSVLLTVFVLCAARAVPRDLSGLQAHMSSPGHPLVETKESEASRLR